MAQYSAPTFPPFAGTPTPKEFITRFRPALATVVKNLQAALGYSIANLIQRPIYPDPDIPLHHEGYRIPNRLLPVQEREPVDVDSAAFQTFSPTNQKLQIDLERARARRHDYLQSKYLEQEQAQTILKSAVNLFMPHESALRKHIAGPRYPTYDNIDVGDLISDLDAYFLRNTNINATRLSVLALLRAKQTKLRKSEDWSAFLTDFLSEITYYDAFGSPLPANDKANLFLDALKRSSDFTEVPLVVTSLFTYEHSHNNELRSIDAIIDLVANLIPSIVSFHSVSSHNKSIRTAYATADISSDEESDTGLLAKARGKKKPTSNPTPVPSKAASTTLSVSATEAVLQEILTLVRDRNPKGKSTQKATTSNTVAAKDKPPHVPLRYCYTHGTTSGPTMHPSSRCPERGPGHENSCTFANRAEYPGAAPA